MGKGQTQRGAVSLFAVIFAMLLLAILTIGFTKLMVREQQQATNNDLSQSAYDAALAGVEDAKRLIRACHQSGGQACAQLAAAQTQCQAVGTQVAGSASSARETVVQSSTTGNAFDQAYTCVLIAMATDDYLYTATEEKAEVIPLKATEAFDTIAIEWYSRHDAGNTPVAIPYTNPAELPAKGVWGATAPPVMRAQVMTPGVNFTPESLDASAASKTIFLRPSGVVSTGILPTNQSDITGLSRATGEQEYSNQPVGVICTAQFAYQSLYACRAELRVGTITPEQSATAVLRLSTLYKGAQVRVSLQRADGVAVRFDGAQPSVDATGRANNLFRRVEARLRIGDDFPYPDYAVDIERGICKDFSVNGGAVLPGACRP